MNTKTIVKNIIRAAEVIENRATDMRVAAGLLDNEAETLRALASEVEMAVENESHALTFATKVRELLIELDEQTAREE